MKRRQLTAILLVLALAAGTLAGCGKKAANAETATTQEETAATNDGEWENVYYNKEYSEEGMKTIKGNASLEMTDYLEEYGFGIGYPDSWATWEHAEELGNQLFYDRVDDGVVIAIGKSEDVQNFLAIYEDMDASYEQKQEAYGKIFENDFPFLAIGVRDAGSTGELFADSGYNSCFSCTEKIGTFGGQEYYFCHNEEVPTEGYSESDLVLIQFAVDSVEEFKDNLVLFPAHEIDWEAKDKEAVDKASAINMSAFQAVDLNGNTVTQDIFKDYDVTMVNVWATYCGPCREELPGLQKAYEQIPENVNIIGLCTDGADNGDLATAIIEKTGVKFTQVVMNDQLKELVGQYALYTPTTFFVDSQGNLIGDVKIGYNGAVDVAEQYLEEINALLK